MIARFAILILLTSCVLGAQVAQAVGLSERNSKMMALFQEFDWQNEFMSEMAEELEDEEPVEDDGEKSSNRLLRELKKDSYSFGHGHIGRILVSRGQSVVSDLIERLPRADGYFLLSLINILSDIPSEKRDRVFIAKLEDELTEPAEFLRSTYIENMIMALAANEAKEGIAVIQRFARADNEYRTIRSSARTALNILGVPEQGLAHHRGYTISETVAVKLSDGDIDGPLELLRVLLGHGLLDVSATIPDSGTFEIAVVQKGSGTIKLSGNLPEDKGTWSLVIGTSRNGRIPIYYEWITGPVAAAGYAGVLERQDDELRVLFGIQMWIS